MPPSARRYERFNPLQQRRWLLACIAVKDAVRQWLWDRGAGPVFPAEIAVDGLPGEADGRRQRADGEPRAAGPRARSSAPRVSVALCRPPARAAPGCAVAIAGAEPPAFTVATGATTARCSSPGQAGRPQPVGPP